MNGPSSRETDNSRPWLVVVIVCVAQSMVVLDATIVNVALPSIQRGLGFRPSNLQWVITTYTLIFGGFMLLGGRAGDVIGRKRVFGAGIVLFTTASLLNGFAQSPAMLIAGRGLQGLGGAHSRPPCYRSSRRASATRTIAPKRWRSGARFPPAAGPSGFCSVAF